MNKLLLAILISLFSFQNISYSQSPVIQSIINQTNLDSLIFFVEELSGEVQTIIGGTPYTIVSRNKDQSGNDKAADYIEQKLEYYGLDVYNQSFSSTGRNVYGVQLGNDYPNQQYIICAHYDDMPSGPIAPGADDNASGTAAVLEAARILSGYIAEYTIIYALWDEEEQGKAGSNFYANLAAATGDSILGVVNLDMIAYDSDTDSVGEIHIRSIANSLSLKDKMIEVNTDYNIGIIPSIINPGTTASDHASFWNNGYGALLLIEEYHGGDFNAYYHTPNDLITHFNQPYYLMMSKIALGTLATLANVTGIVPVDDNKNNIIVSKYFLEQNYPNPFNPSTTIKYQIPDAGLVVLKVYDVLGNEVAILVNEEKAAGSYEIEFNATVLPSGIYFYRLQAVPTGRQAGDFVETKKMVLLR